MGQSAEAALVTRYDRIFRLIQHRLAEQIKTPFEIRLWGDRIYRFGKGSPLLRCSSRIATDWLPSADWMS